MPISGIVQPEIININSDLRLRKYDGYFDFAYSWYQDIESLELIDGKDKAIPYTMDRMKRMYEYLNAHGELYFIEIKENGKYAPVGDITFWEDDMPVVISKKFRNQGIGSAAVQCLIKRAKDLGYKQIHVNEIYSYNTGSQRLFEKCGFIKDKIKENGAGYLLNLM